MRRNYDQALPAIEIDSQTDEAKEKDNHKLEQFCGVILGEPSVICGQRSRATSYFPHGFIFRFPFCRQLDYMLFPDFKSLTAGPTSENE